MNNFDCYLKYIRILDETPMTPSELEKMEQEQLEKQNGTNQPASTNEHTSQK